MSIADRYDAYQIRDHGTYQDAWVYAATRNGHLLPETKNALGATRTLLDAYNDRYDADENLVAIALGRDAPRAGAACLEHGANTAYVAEHDALTRFKPTTHARMVLEACTRTDAYKDYDLPRYLLFPATEDANLLAAHVASHLDTGVIPDIEDATIEDLDITHPFKTGSHTQPFPRTLTATRRPHHGASRVRTACLDNEARDFHPQCGVLAPSAGTTLPPDPQRVHQGRILQIPTGLDSLDDPVTVEKTHERTRGPQLDRAQRIVAVGRGIEKDPDRGLRLAQKLAAALEGEVAVSRGVLTARYPVSEQVDELVTEDRQIGQTGSNVRAQVYVAAGIHGAPRHNMGIREAERVIAVNEDPEAPIREVADVFIEGDLFEVLASLTERVREGES